MAVRIICILAAVSLCTQIGDLGEQYGRAWADFDGDGFPDYCRVVGTPPSVSQRIAVSFSTGRNFEAQGTGPTIVSDPLDVGYAETRAWADFDGDGKADFVRLVGAGNSYFLRVTFSGGRSFGPEVTSGLIDPGYKEGRAWVDWNGDGKADYARIVGVPGHYKIKITFSNGRSFGQEIMSEDLDPGYPDSRIWQDVNGDNKDDFVRVVGNNREFIAVTLSTGSGFGKTYLRPVSVSK
jgi:hypothetical protein